MSKRLVLKSLLGATLALPLLDSMVPALSRAATKAPVRLGFVYHPTGMIMEQYTPAAEGAGFAFTPTLKPLEAYRDRLNVFTGLAQMNGYFGHGANRSAWPGWRSPCAATAAANSGSNCEPTRASPWRPALLPALPGCRHRPDGLGSRVGCRRRRRPA